MNVREKFEEEVCSKCDAYKDCIKDIGKQAQCATLANYFNVKRFLNPTPTPVTQKVE